MLLRALGYGGDGGAGGAGQAADLVQDVLKLADDPEASEAGSLRVTLDEDGGGRRRRRQKSEEASDRRRRPAQPLEPAQPSLEHPSSVHPERPSSPPPLGSGDGWGGLGPEAPPGAWTLLCFACGGVTMSVCEKSRRRRRGARAAAERKEIVATPLETRRFRQPSLASTSSRGSTITVDVSRQGSSFSMNSTGSLIEGKVVHLDGLDCLANADKDKLERFDRQLRLLAARKKNIVDDTYLKGLDILTSYKA